LRFELEHRRKKRPVGPSVASEVGGQRSEVKSAVRCVFIPHDLSIGGEKSVGKELGEQAKLVADNPTVIVLPNAGHWILEEKPKETTDALLKFLDFDGK
jgi:hypothetical protein